MLKKKFNTDNNTTLPADKKRLIVNIEKLVSGGLGLCNTKTGIIFTPFVFPGEQAEIELCKVKSDYSVARLLRLVKASPLRQEPPCPLFTFCGGCQYQMMPYENQLIEKKNIIQESIQRIVHFTPQINPVIPSDNSFYYRNKASYQVFNINQIGFCRPGTTKPFAIEKCILMEKPIIKQTDIYINETIEKQKINYKKCLVIRSNFEGKTITSLNKQESFTEKIKELKFIVNIDSFFQINRTVIPKWLDYIKQKSQDYSLGLGLIDLYAGCGIISQHLAPLYENVVGIEIDKNLVKNGNRGLEMNNIHNAQYIQADANQFDSIGLKYDTIIINPPRKGIQAKTLKAIIQAKPKAIIYSSCNPDTFARDLCQFKENNYTINEIQPFDMFPQTRHCEVVGIMTKKM